MQELDLPPAFTEVTSAVRGLKLCKTPGPNMVPSELLVGGYMETSKYLHSLLLKISQGKSIHSSWKDVLLNTIYKHEEDRAIGGDGCGII